MKKVSSAFIAYEVSPSLGFWPSGLIGYVLSMLVAFGESGSSATADTHLYTIIRVETS